MEYAALSQHRRPVLLEFAVHRAAGQVEEVAVGVEEGVPADVV